MVFLNQDQVLGEIVPDVLISRITLETAGRPPAAGEDDPHVDSRSKPQKVKNPFTGKLIIPAIRPDFLKKTSAAIQPNFLNKGIAKINLPVLNKSDTSAEKLIVTVDLVLKEKLDNGLIGTWFKNQNFSKYIRLKIIQSTKLELTQEASNNRTLLAILDKNKFMPLGHDVVTNGLNFISNKLNLTPAHNIHQVLDSSIQSKILNVKDDIEGDKSSLTNKYTEVDADGNTIVSFTFRARFELTNPYPEHLSYFAFSYLDLPQLAKDYRLTLNQNILREPMGKVVSDIVIDNSEVVGQSFIYTDADGGIWVGAIDESNQGGAFGITKDGTRIPLHKSLVGNSKVQDNRDFHDIDRLVLNFSVVDNEILNSKMIGPRNDRSVIELPEMAFSDMSLARDEDGHSRFFFSINFKKLLESNATFAKIFKNQESANMAMRDSSIMSMKVFRRRIKGSPEIGSAADISQLFDSNQIDDAIVVSGEKSYKTFREVNNKVASLREINDISTAGIEGGQNLSDIRHFTGVDKTAPDITDGYFIYGIDMEIQDTSYDFLFNRIVEIRSARERLEKYYQEAIQLSSTKTIISNANPHIDFPGEDKGEQSTVKIGNFDPFLNRFTQKFIDEQRKKYSIGIIANPPTPWGDAISIYIKNLRLFSEDSTALPFDKFEKSLFYFTHPATGNPSGILKVIKLLESLESSVSRLIGFSPSVSSGLLSNPSASPSGMGLKFNNITPIVKVATKRKIAIKSFKVNKIFSNIFNGSIEKSVGYDFLDISGSNDQLNGLKTISGDEYASRVERETNHYFVKPNDLKPNINLKFKDQVYTANDHIDNTSFSYLTPARVKFADKFNVVRLGNSPTPLMQRDALAHLDFSIKSYNSVSEPIKDRKTETKLSINKTTQNLMYDTVRYFAKMNVEPILFHNETRINLTDVLKDKPIPRIPAVIDPIIQDNSICGIGNKKEIVAAVANTNPIPLLLELSKRLKTERLSVAQAPGIKRPTFADPSSFKEKVSIKAFDLASRESKLNNIIQDPRLHSSEAFFQGMPHHTTLELALTKLPNQVKSLFLSRTSPDIIRKNWLSHPTDPLLSQEDSSEFRLSYRMINTVQVFNGYQKSADGQLLLKKPQWEPLTLFRYNQSVGDAMLCRLVPYENKVIGIERDKTLELPHYNEYFLLKPNKLAKGIELPVIVRPPVLTPLPPQVIIKPRIIETIVEPFNKDRFKLSKDLVFNIDPRLEAFPSSEISARVALGDIRSVTVNVSDPVAVRVAPLPLNLHQENATQMAVRTEFMSNNIVNNRQSSGTSFGSRLF